MPTPDAKLPERLRNMACLAHASEDDLYVIGEAIEAIRTAVGWRPMESAPRDGTRVLLCYDSEQMLSIPFVGGARVVGDDWYWDGESPSDYSTEAVAATYGRIIGWQPCPPPPSAPVATASERGGCDER